jgi:thymidylate synthase (FAD)
LEVVEPHAYLVGEAGSSPETWAERALLLIEECGRVSHKSEGRIKPGSAVPFVRKVAIEWGHESILEHASLTVCFVGSRSMSHQLVRHRIAAYTQESQRFCDYATPALGLDEQPECERVSRLKVVVPPSVSADLPAGSLVYQDNVRITDANCVLERLSVRRSEELPPEGVDLRSPVGVFLASVMSSYATYQKLRELNIPAEDAREVLPNATKTEVYTTFNLREWRHFFKMRLDKHAQWQIRKVAREVFNFLLAVCPVVLEGLRTHSGEVI